jgi:hypothetical protein
MPSLWVTGPDGVLLPLESEGHVSEKDFQKVLADNPAVLASALAQGEEETWLLIDRELPIKAEESDTGTWKLDHLFVASDGRPVLVEVKRSSDPRARREVVAQMLDYAASFDTDWDAERLRLRRQERFTAATTGAFTTEMEQFLAVAGHEDEDQLWSAVQTQIDAGHIRLLFVADQLSPTLVRIIEYLNRQLQDAEVLGVEVARHAGSSHDVVAYQPVIRGRSSAAAQRKAPTQRRTRVEFDQAFLATHDQMLLDQVNALVARAEKLGGFESIGTSKLNPALYINFRTNGGSPVYWPFLVAPPRNKLIVRIQKLRAHHAFRDPSVRDELLARTAEAAGVPAVLGNVDGAPWVPLDRLLEPGVVDRLAAVLEWVTTTADASATPAQEDAG